MLTCLAFALAALGVAAPPAPAFKANVLYTVDGSLPFDHFGFSAAPLVDLDGDGVVDYAVGAPNRSNSSLVGRAFVLSGRTGAVLRVHGGTNYGDRFGHAISSLPDLDGDGVADYGVGAIWAAGGFGYPGSLSLYSGKTGAQLSHLTGIADGECFGAALARVSDLDGDGIGDFAVGVRFGGAQHSDPAYAEGHVRVLSGATLSPMKSWSGKFDGDWFGEQVVNVGDQDGDGQADVAVAAWAWPANARRGQVRIFSSRTGETLATIAGAAKGDWFAWSVAATPDLDGDGRQDLVVGSLHALAGNGRVDVVSSATGAKLMSWTGAKAEALGASVACLGDLDHDGTVELALGASDWNANRGHVLIVSSVPGSAPIATVEGRYAGDHFGDMLAALPDVDLDGRIELGIGATGFPHGAGFGRLTVVAVK